MPTGWATSSLKKNILNLSPAKVYWFRQLMIRKWRLKRKRKKTCQGRPRTQSGSNGLVIQMESGEWQMSQHQNQEWRGRASKRLLLVRTWHKTSRKGQPQQTWLLSLMTMMGLLLNQGHQPPKLPMPITHYGYGLQILAENKMSKKNFSQQPEKLKANTGTLSGFSLPKREISGVSPGPWDQAPHTISARKRKQKITKCQIKQTRLRATVMATKIHRDRQICTPKDGGKSTDLAKRRLNKMQNKNNCQKIK